MRLFQLFKKKEDPLKSMDKQERKEFLSNDLIERMIRIEQQVSATFGRGIHFRSTDYYKKLSQKERLAFEKYLKKKHHNKIAYGVLLALFFLSFSFSLTGNVVSGALKITSPLPHYLVLFFSLFFILLILTILISNSKRKTRLDRVHHLSKKIRNSRKPNF